MSRTAKKVLVWAVTALCASLVLTLPFFFSGVWPKSVEIGMVVLLFVLGIAHTAVRGDAS